jgi:hypothetical protein
MAKKHTDHTDPDPKHCSCHAYCLMISHLGLVQLSADDKGHVPEGQQSRGRAPRKRKTIYRGHQCIRVAPASVFRIHDILVWTRIFVIDPQDASKKLIKKKSFSAYYFLKVHLHHFSKIKERIEGSGSIPLTNGFGSGRPKNMWIRWIRNTGPHLTISENFRQIRSYEIVATGRIDTGKDSLILRTRKIRCFFRFVPF